MMQGYWPYIWIVVLIILSAFFSGSEISYASANRLRMKKASDGGSLRARVAYYIFDRYDDALPSILVGNNLVNIAASSVAAVIAIDLFGEAGAVYSSLIMTVLIIIFGEIMPKILAVEHCEGFARGVALPLRAFMFITKPVVFVVTKSIHGLSGLWKGSQDDDSGMTEEELASIIETVEDEGVIDEDRSELLQSALEFSSFSAQDVVTPRVDMLAIDIDDGYEAIVDIIDSSPYSRIPVYEDSIDNVIGILILNHFFRAAIDAKTVDIRSILMEPCFIHKTMKLPAVLAELKRQKTHIAIVTDEYGGTLGVLTMEDVLEQIVGDIWDETDEIVDMIEQIGDNDYRVNGDMSVYDLFDELDLDDRGLDSDYTSVGGWAIEMLHGFPHEGDTFDYENLTVSVEKMDDMRITSLIAHVAPKQDSQEDI